MTFKNDVTGYKLSRAFWDFSFENPHKIKPNHSAIFFFAIEHCNRLGWKQIFGFPTSMVLESIGMKSYNSYKKYFDDLVEWGFIKVHEYSKNQYSSNIIELSLNDKAHDKALDKALIKHNTKQELKQSESTGSINKQYNKEQLNNKQLTQDEMNKQKISQPENQTDLENNETLLKEVEKVMLPKNHYLDLYNRAVEAFKKEKSGRKRLDLGNETYDNFKEIYKTYTVGELKTALKGLMTQKNAIKMIFTPHHLLKDNMFETYLHAGKNGIKNLYSQNQKKQEFKL